ncbi:hypothetical protein CK224_21225 [Mesorhizobium sp. WSM3862]|nr:hypothetical protein CK224_21225 [Mesorhizobium sp. WSM3862]
MAKDPSADHRSVLGPLILFDDNRRARFNLDLHNRVPADVADCAEQISALVRGIVRPHNESGRDFAASKPLRLETSPSPTGRTTGNWCVAMASFR